MAVVEVLLVALGYATAPLIAARKLADVPAPADDGGLPQPGRARLAAV